MKSKRSGLPNRKIESTHLKAANCPWSTREDEILITAVMDLRREPRRWRDLI
ncbi:MAG: hypothetical protein ABR607_04865 [Pyrinomonadaceae bacterium]